MKSLLNILALAIVALLMFISCNNSKNNGREEPAKPYATPEEAAEKAKQDFLEVLQNDKELKLGIDAATLKNAQAGKAVQQISLSFDKLLKTDSVTDIGSLEGSEENAFVPFVAGNKIISVAELSKNTDGWRVAALAGAKIASDLDIIKQVAGDSSFQTLTIYQVPNLNATLYGVKKDGHELFFSDYSERFSLKQGLPLYAIIAVLKADAAEFQKMYGEDLKKEKLVK